MSINGTTPQGRIQLLEIQIENERALIREAEERNQIFEKELGNLLEKTGQHRKSNTPCSVLAAHLVSCLHSFNNSMELREAAKSADLCCSNMGNLPPLRH